MSTLESKELNELISIIDKLENHVKRMDRQGSSDVITDRLHDELNGDTLTNYIEEYVSVIKYESVNRLNQLFVKE